MTALPVFFSHILASIVATASLGLFLLGSELRAQEPAAGGPVSLASLKERFEEQKELLARPVADLNQLYEKQLATLRETAKAAGDLDKVLIVDEELREYRSGSREVPPKSFPELDRLRGIYSTELEKRQKTLVEARTPFVASYIQQLDVLSKELTRQDRLPEALAAREEAERMRTLAGAGGPDTSSSVPVGGPTGGGRLQGFGFGNKPDPTGLPPRGITDIVSLHYWERDQFDAGWIALRANGSVLTDQERRVSSSRDVIVSCDASRAGILMVRDDGTLDSSLCQFQPPQERQAEFTDLVSVVLGHAESADQASAVAIRRDGSLVWWGQATTVTGVKGPPSEARTGIASITSGRGVYTALKKDGKLVSWKFVTGGDGVVALPANVADERFSQIVMSEQHTLGLKNNGEVVAWGQNSEGQTNVPPDLGKCTEVRVLHNVLSLARKEDGTWAAWGRTYGGLRDRLHGATKMTHVVGRQFPPGEYAYAVWIEEKPD